LISSLMPGAGLGSADAVRALPSNARTSDAVHAVAKMFEGLNRSTLRQMRDMFDWFSNVDRVVSKASEEAGAEG
jgi:hypothetical protein